MTDTPPYNEPAADINAQIKARALEHMQAAVKGNGIKPEDVKIEKYEPEALEFLAVTTLTPDTKLSIKRQGGKVTGPMLVDSANQFQEVTNKEVVKITRSADVIHRVKEAIMTRKDKGLAVKNELIKFPFLHRDFVAHEACQICKSQGKIKCPRCHGKGEEQCPRCHARGSEPCPTCGGRQFVAGPQGQNQHCQRCNGSGRTPCSQCHEAKQIKCLQCKAAGLLQCTQCNGHGWTSAICRAEINMIGNFDFDREALPPKAVSIIEKMGADLQAHTIIGITERPQDTEKEQKNIEIFYHVKAPTAQAEFQIKSLTVPAYIFGTQGMLFDTTAFLEKIMSPGIKALQSAAKGHGDVSAHLQKAGRYKTLRQIILATSKTSPEKALNAIMQKNPIGVTEETCKKLIIMTKMALKLIGKKPRQIGYGLGLLTAIALGAAYFMFLRTKISLPSPLPQEAIDGAAVIAALAIGYFISDIYAKKAIHKSLQSLLGKSA